MSGGREAFPGPASGSRDRRGRGWAAAAGAWAPLLAWALLSPGPATAHHPISAPHAPRDTVPLLRVGQATATSGSRVALTLGLEGHGVRLGSLHAVVRFDPSALLPTGVEPRPPLEVEEGGGAGLIVVRTPVGDSARVAPGPLLDLTFQVVGSSGLRVPVAVEAVEVRDTAGRDITGRVVLRDGAVWIR